MSEEGDVKVKRNVSIFAEEKINSVNFSSEILKLGICEIEKNKFSATG